MNIADAFFGIASHQPDHIAMVSGDVSLTFRDFVSLASKTARRLTALGFQAGDRIGISLQRPEETIIASLGVWMIGATSLVLDFRARAGEKQSIATTYQLRAMIESRTGTASEGCESIAAGESWAATIAGEDASFFDAPRAEHPIMISLTSGTTGVPQGLSRSHKTFLCRYLNHRTSVANPLEGVFVISLPLVYDASLHYTLFHLLDGGTVHFLPVLSSPGELAEKYLSLSATIALVVPPQLAGLLELSAGRGTPMFPSLKALGAAGGALSAEINLRAYRELTNCYRVDYGSSLTGGRISELLGEDLLRNPGSVGRPHRMNNVRITTPEGEPVATGEIGLIRVRSPTMADAILGDDREFSDRIVDGWAVPGDLGYFDEHGFLTLAGRASEMMIRNGVNIFPQEIEAALAKHPDVSEVAVVGYPSASSGEEVAAFVVVRNQLDADALRSFARSAINPDKRPRDFRIIASLPRNNAGKIERRKLVELLKAEQQPQSKG